MKPEERLLDRAKELQKQWKKMLSKMPTPQEVVSWASNILTLAGSVLPTGDYRIGLVQKNLDDYQPRPGGIHVSSRLGMIAGVLDGIASDLEGGHFADFRSQIRRDVDADFLTQAEQLLQDGFKDPAAMITGAVLEDSLRQLCRKHGGVSEGKSIEKMNIPLCKAGVYDLTVQKQVTAWADIRNNAAHGHFTKYDEKQVAAMRQGVLDFVSKYL